MKGNQTATNNIPHPEREDNLFLHLSLARAVKEDPRTLEEFDLRRHERYTEQYAYAVLLVNEDKIKGARIVKTRETLNLLAEKYDLLLHPLPVAVPDGFWQEWRRAKTEEGRLELVKKHGLLRDDKVFVLTCLVLDVDTPYSEAEPVVLELFQKLGVKGYELGKTKSGNLRGVIYLRPLRIEKKTDDGKENKEIKAFFLKANTKHKNGHTHLQNARELLAIMTAYLRRKGLKADTTFVDRLNHPVWYGEGYYTRMRKERGENRLYDLYRRAKTLQREENLWNLEGKSLTEVFWRKKKENKAIVKVPSFIAERQIQTLDNLLKWRLAVEKLAEKYTERRFTRVMLPAVSWALWLGIDRHEVEDHLRKLLKGKRDFDKDMEKAWKYATPSPFEWGGKTQTTYDLKELTKRFLERTQEGTPRQELLREIFGGQVWLLRIVEKFCLREGYVSVAKAKLTPGPGRMAYIYTTTEKGKSFAEALSHKEKNALESQNKGGDPINARSGSEIETKNETEGREGKSQYLTPPCLRGEQEDLTRSSGLVGDGNNNVPGDAAVCVRGRDSREGRDGGEEGEAPKEAPRDETHAQGTPPVETPSPTTESSGSFSGLSGKVKPAVPDAEDGRRKIRGTLDPTKVLRDRLKEALLRLERSAGTRLTLPTELKVEALLLLFRGATLRTVMNMLAGRGYEADRETLKAWALALEEEAKKTLGWSWTENGKGNGKKPRNEQPPKKEKPPEEEDDELPF